MRVYKQLTQEQRYQIYALNKTNISQAEIARIVGVNQSTICCEFKRNRGLRGYRPKQAQALSNKRKNDNHHALKMTRELITIIEERLSAKSSPEQISGWLLDEMNISISHETIYRHIIILICVLLL